MFFPLHQPKREPEWTRCGVPASIKSGTWRERDARFPASEKKRKGGRIFPASIYKRKRISALLWSGCGPCRSTHFSLKHSAENRKWTHPRKKPSSFHCSNGARQGRAKLLQWRWFYLKICEKIRYEAYRGNFWKLYRSFQKLLLPLLTECSMKGGEKFVKKHIKTVRCALSQKPSSRKPRYHLNLPCIPYMIENLL